MISKTPQFDTKLDAILDELIPHERVCVWSGMNPYCENKFSITIEDIEFLKMLRVPTPNFCPTCRKIKRLMNINNYRLYKRTCQAPEHNETILSTLPPNCPF